jgi:hypothetical protein
MFTTEENYTHAVIINQAMPNLTVPRHCVIGLAFEPRPFLQLTPQFIHWAQRHVSVYHIGDASGLPLPFREGFAFMWHLPAISLTPPDRPRQFCSIMVSQKTFAIGHQYRHHLVKAILNSSLPIDIYGRGCRFYGNDSRLKGEFEENERTMYENYHFHIAVENFSEPHYISEKILNPLICGTTPIYWGSPHIAEYFPDQVLTLTGNLSEDLQFIKKVLFSPEKYRRESTPLLPSSTEESANVSEKMDIHRYWTTLFRH